MIFADRLVLVYLQTSTYVPYIHNCAMQTSITNQAPENFYFVFCQCIRLQGGLSLAGKTPVTVSLTEYLKRPPDGIG
jgi:hypothetical protein